jgi:hypothetical protein
MDTVTAQDQQALAGQLAQVRERLAALKCDLQAIDGELQDLEPERRQHRLMGEACTALEELAGSGGAELFWGKGPAAGAAADHLRQVRGRVDAFSQRIAGIEERREAILEQIGQQNQETDWLEDDLFEALEEEEQRNLDWDIERELSEAPHPLVLLWTRGREDDQRFRRSLATALSVVLFLALVAPWIEFPVPPEEAAPDVPERVVRLLETRRRPPPPPIEAPKPRPQEQVVKREPVPPKPVEPEKAVAEKTPDTTPKGILAFREKFAAIEQDQVVARLGSQANINDAGGSSGRPQRAMLTTNAPGSSGGINLAALSRGVSGNGGAGMAGVQVARATSSIAGTGRPGAERPRSGDSVGNSRTDEEIQIVFDRYKAALYRLYNRELRKDPTLRGQMVLRLTIEPDGSVSLCELQATDMDAAELSAQVVERVRTIDFGAKEGITAITILYPIDFLPAA